MSGYRALSMMPANNSSLTEGASMSEELELEGYEQWKEDPEGWEEVDREFFGETPVLDNTPSHPVPSK